MAFYRFIESTDSMLRVGRCGILSLKTHRENDGVLSNEVTKHFRVYVRRCVFVHLKMCTVYSSKYYTDAKWTKVLLHAYFYLSKSFSYSTFNSVFSKGNFKIQEVFRFMILVKSSSELVWKNKANKIFRNFFKNLPFFLMLLFQAT